ncbi:MAG: aldehyde dehydrogenase [Leptolyngbyaceae cyanobacterium SM1_1_3]|nr:aldehyde dehydrogenase [Leptolyngbyaceae cyanobacterium SM1_1_3]NJN03730.1 aldehyde dehydrogenase [Leptolyngbyaceae cyanobacterium RM1_1_2]
MSQLAVSSTADMLSKQRQFFASGQTRSIEFRIEQLQRLKQAIRSAQPRVLKALADDLSKPSFEAYTTELSVTGEISQTLKHLKRWMKPKGVGVPLPFLPASAQIYPEPLGVVLIIGPWNYPFQLTMTPLVGAIAAGNCAIVKPSEIAPKTSEAIAELIDQTFAAEYIAAVEGGVETSQDLLSQHFDHIFFTGSTYIGKVVMEAAAKHLTPVTLELGGKSPCVVEANVNVDVTAKRIVWGKFLNAGQTCIAPDYILVNRKIKPELLTALKAALKDFYGDDPKASPDFGRIVSDKHFQRLSKLIGGHLVVGGQSDAAARYIAPTIIDQVSPEHPAMQDEIFGPLLPVLEYETLDQAIAFVNARPKPLALYFFSNSSRDQNRIQQETSSGGLCFNETITHVAISDLPFGGVGQSGLGAYHGKTSFDTFTHYKSVLKKPFWLDVPVRYPPYEGKLKWAKKLLG